MPFGEDEPLTVEEVDDEHWKLMRPLRYVGNKETFVIPVGFTTNFASVPRPFQWLIPRSGRYTKAAVLHDYLWRLANEGRFNRCDADGIFRRAMWELGVSFARRWLMWAAVRCGAGLRELARCGLEQLALVLLVFVLAVLFVLPAGVVVQVFLWVFWGVELALVPILSLFKWLSARLPSLFSGKRVNTPTVYWWSGQGAGR